MTNQKYINKKLLRNKISLKRAKEVFWQVKQGKMNLKNKYNNKVKRQLLLNMMKLIIKKNNSKKFQKSKTNKNLQL